MPLVDDLEQLRLLLARWRADREEEAPTLGRLFGDTPGAPPGDTPRHHGFKVVSLEEWATEDPLGAIGLEEWAREDDGGPW
jgi:hypothetical protein